MMAFKTIALGLTATAFALGASLGFGVLRLYEVRWREG